MPFRRRLLEGWRRTLPGDASRPAVGTPPGGGRRSALPTASFSSSQGRHSRSVSYSPSKGAAATSEPHTSPGQPAGPVQRVWVGSGRPAGVRAPGQCWPPGPGHTPSSMALEEASSRPSRLLCHGLELEHCSRKHMLHPEMQLCCLPSASFVSFLGPLPSDLGKQVGT